MKRLVGRIAVTLVAVLLAGVAGWQLWDYYMLAPWTRDGRVRADVVGITPDVSGLVASVAVRDNQAVRRGDILFEIDRARFELAVQQTEAAALARWSAYQQSQRDSQRLSRLDQSAVSVQAQERAVADTQQAAAAYQQAIADRDLARLNLERALKVGDELGGHIVSGHVDGVGTVVAADQAGGSLRLVVAAEAEIAPFVAPKGSIAVDGISLTVNDVTDRPDGQVHFALNIIPHTAAMTTLDGVSPGRAVNLEIDVLARYLGRMEQLRARKS